jgi:uncharacterized protein (TIGR02001 family)
MTKTTIQSAIILVCALSGAAFAQTAAPAAAKAPEPDYTLSYNVGVTTDYRYRGISQSRLKPALQGGVDFAHKNGVYLGAWASSISWIKDNTPNGVSTKGPIELDLYGGYKAELSKELAYDVGVLQYAYLGNTLADTMANAAGFRYENANTTELYGALTYKQFTAKYSHSLGRLFGTLGSKNSGYIDFSANFDLGNGWSVVPHIGLQRISDNAKGNYSNVSPSYTDYSVTVNKDIDGLVLSGALVGTDANAGFYASPVSGFNMGKTGLVLSIKKNF